MTERLSYESVALKRIHRKAVTTKNECFFVGFLDGILANDRLDETELEPLIAECAAICRLVSDEDAAEIVREATAGHHDTKGEMLDLIAQIAEVRARKIDTGCKRSSANRLLGMCAGINCDGIVTTAEAERLLKVLSGRHDLSDDPRIAALRHRLLDALEDDVIDAEESADISSLITALVGDSYSDTGIPSSEAVPVIEDLDDLDEGAFGDRRVVLTGKFRSGTRTEVSRQIADLGGHVQAAPSSLTDIVVIGSEGSPFWTHKSHGGKLAKALSMRRDGPVPRIYTEVQLHFLK